MIAASGASKALLREEFPSLTFIELPGYDIKVGKNRTDTIFRMMGSIPKILIRIKRERAWLKAFVGRERVDLVISDNRYGLAMSNVVCVFITHQLVIRTPFGGWADALLQRMNYRLIRRFSGCWIPDVENDGGLAGALSHPAKFPSIPVRYIGWLSRFAARPVPETGGYILVLLSGPEPQRTLFETLILRQASGCPFRIVLVRGLPGGGRLPAAVPPGVILHDHLSAKELEPVIGKAELVIARSGYSTVMDLMRMGKRAVFVPTPGQTEQEYLGRWLAERGRGVCVGQSGFSLAAAVDAARGFSFRPLVEEDGARLRSAVAEIVGGGTG